MSTPFSIRTMIIGLLLVALIVAGRLALYFHGSAVQAGEQVKQQQKILTQQAGLIATLQAQDEVNRALVAAQQQHEQKLRQQHDILQRKYREAIKDDPCAAQSMPGAVVDLLQQNTATGARAGDKPAP
ncbi:Protein of uncharacterised function (DUF2570) [Serratia grimesii]|uniref:hypothetical protein n=1 Tax=Serratia grimesii TaxID=82995 RepID=UPI0021771A9C|nr:hypothetical protein [Serratia grimesii]CAI1502595.1 Protein of uncharacterised function (DUF2570) [Serratia grimesii]